MKVSRNAIFGRVAPEALMALSRAMLPRGLVVSLMYHEVLPDDQDYEAWTVVRESDFRAQMEYLAEALEITTLDEALSGNRSEERAGRVRALVTLDDGYRGNHGTVLPIVEEMRIPVTIFVATSAVLHQTSYWYDRVEGALAANGEVSIDLRHRTLGTYRIPASCRGEERWTHIRRVLNDLKRLSPAERERAAGDVTMQVGEHVDPLPVLRPLTISEVQDLSQSRFITLGAHSHGHEILTQLPAEEIRDSVLRSKRLLEQWTGKSIRHFAYPNGNHNAEVARVVEECGFVSSHTTKGGFWKAPLSPLAIPRFGIGRYASLGWFKALVSGLGC